MGCNFSGQNLYIDEDSSKVNFCANLFHVDMYVNLFFRYKINSPFGTQYLQTYEYIKQLAEYFSSYLHAACTI